MKLKKSFLSLALTTLFASGMAQAASKATVEFKSDEMTNKQVSLLSHIQEHLDELAQDLPEGQQLKLSSVNMGVVGAANVTSRIQRPPRELVEMTSTRQIEIDIPQVTQLAFNYQITNAQGDVFKSDSVELKRSFNLSRHGQSDVKSYKRLLSSWYAKTFRQE